MDSLGCDYLTEDWRLFIDSSKVSLKGVLLHSGNRYPSIPIAHAIHMKETYGNMQTLLEKIDYKKYAWNICGDLKVIALLLGLQLGYTKFCCFLCEWDSLATDKYYLVREWKKRHNLVPGEKNVMNNPLVEQTKYFCHLYI